MTKRAFWAMGGAGLSLSFLFLAMLQAWIIQQRGQLKGGSTANQLMYLPTPAQAKLMSLGFRGLVADYYWIKALQYFTDPELARKSYRNLSDILEVVVGIDPDFEYAYKFAGVAVPYDSGRLKFQNTEQSTRFLERGVERFPDNWQLHFFLGYNYLNFHSRPIDAAKQFAAASKIPGSPNYLKVFVARVFTSGGRLEDALEWTRQSLNNAVDPDIREMLEKRLKDLETEQVLQAIEKAGREKKPIALPPGYWLDSQGIAHAPQATERMQIYKQEAP